MKKQTTKEILEDYHKIVSAKFEKAEWQDIYLALYDSIFRHTSKGRLATAKGLKEIQENISEKTRCWE